MNTQTIYTTCSKHLIKYIRISIFYIIFILPLSPLIAQSPSSVLPDITQFKIDFPLDNDGDDYAGVDYDDRDDPLIKAATQTNLSGYTASSPFNQYFFASGNEVVFRAHCAGALTSKNSYPRCELRERVNGGDDLWEFDDEHELNATFRITNLPNVKKEVCVLQIKGNDSNNTAGTEEAFRLDYRADTQGFHTEENESAGPQNILSYSLGQTVKARLYVNNGRIYINLENLSNGDTWSRQYDSDYSHGYFKAGCYTQSSIWKEKNGIGDESPNAYGEVRFSQLVLDDGDNTPSPSNGHDGLSTIQAENYDDESGIQKSNGGNAIGYINTGDWAKYDNVSFSSTVRSVKLRVSKGNSGTGKVIVRKGSSNGTILGQVSFGNTGGWTSFKEYNIGISNTSGTQDIYLTFEGNLDVDWLKFSTSSVDDGGGGGGGHDAFSTIQAEDYDDESGIQKSNGGNAIGYINTGDWAKYDNVSFGSTAKSVKLRVSKGNSGTGKVIVRKGSSNGTILGQVSFGNTGGWTSFKEYNIGISNTSGTQDIYLTFQGNLDVDWLKFSTSSVDDGGGGSGNVVTMRKKNATNYALDGGNGGSNGQNLYLWSYNSSNANQQWVEISRGGNFYSYQKKNTNYCIDGGNNGSNEQNVKLWTCNSSNQNQQWEKISMGNNTYRLEKRNADDYCIDGKGGGSNRQNVHLWRNNDSNENQQWIFTVVGSAKIEQAQDIALFAYPNPFNNELTIELPNDIESNEMTIQLLDITGKIVEERTQLVTGQIIQITSDLPKGVYVLKWSDEKNQLFTVRKVVKQ